MKIIGSQMRELLNESGMILHERRSPTEVILFDPIAKTLELWSMNDDHAGFTIEIDGVGYEFVKTESVHDYV